MLYLTRYYARLSKLLKALLSRGMATDNPKISVYVPPDLHSLLIKFQKSGGAKSLSNAVVEILRIHFGVDSLSSNPSNALSNSLVEQRQKLDAQIEKLATEQLIIWNQLEEIQAKISNLTETDLAIVNLNRRLNNLESTLAQNDYPATLMQSITELQNRVNQLEKNSISKQSKSSEEPLQQKLFDNNIIGANQPSSEVDRNVSAVPILNQGEIINTSNDVNIKTTNQLLQLLTEIDPEQKWNSQRLRTLRISKTKVLPITVKNLVIDWVGKEEGNALKASHLWSIKTIQTKILDDSNDQNLLDSE